MMKRTRRFRKSFLRGAGLALATAAIAAPAAQGLPQSDGYRDVVTATPAQAPLITDARDRPAPVAVSPAPLITDARDRPATAPSSDVAGGRVVVSSDDFAWQELGMGIAVGLGAGLLLVGIALVTRRGRLAHT
jgi:hypothetical protein